MPSSVALLMFWAGTFVGGAGFCFGLLIAITRRTPFRNPGWDEHELRILGVLNAVWGVLLAAQGLLFFMGQSGGFSPTRDAVQGALFVCEFGSSIALLALALAHETRRRVPPTSGRPQGQ
jgi:hypothetical protein